MMVSKSKKMHDLGIHLGSECDLGCMHAKDSFYGKIYCEKYGWIFKNTQCRNYKPRS